MYAFFSGAFFAGAILTILCSLVFSEDYGKFVPMALWTLFCGIGAIIFK